MNEKEVSTLFLSCCVGGAFLYVIIAAILARMTNRAPKL